MYSRLQFSEKMESGFMSPKESLDMYQSIQVMKIIFEKFARPIVIPTYICFDSFVIITASSSLILFHLNMRVSAISIFSAMIFLLCFGLAFGCKIIQETTTIAATFLQLVSEKQKERGGSNTIDSDCDKFMRKRISA